MISIQILFFIERYSRVHHIVDVYVVGVDIVVVDIVGVIVLMLFCHQDLVEQQQMGSNPDYGIPTPTLVSPPKVGKIEDRVPA